MYSLAVCVAQTFLRALGIDITFAVKADRKQDLGVSGGFLYTAALAGPGPQKTIVQKVCRAYELENRV